MHTPTSSAESPEDPLARSARQAAHSRPQESPEDLLVRIRLWVRETGGPGSEDAIDDLDDLADLVGRLRTEALLRSQANSQMGHKIAWYRDTLSGLLSAELAPKGRVFISPNGTPLPPDSEFLHSGCPGWRGLENRLIAALYALIGPTDEYGQLTGSQPAWRWSGAVTQVKEKCGSLRFYVGSSNWLVDDLIEQAEQESLKTCQECGKPGEPRSESGWITTLCDEHTDQARNGPTKEAK